MVLRLALALFAFGLPLCAQAWEELRDLKPGDRVRIVETSGHEYQGAFRAVSADSLTIAAGAKEVAVERPKIRRVQVRSSSRRVRNVVIGVAIGLAIGVTVDQTVGAYLRNETGDSGRGVTYAAPIAVFGG